MKFPFPYFFSKKKELRRANASMRVCGHGCFFTDVKGNSILISKKTQKTSSKKITLFAKALFIFISFL